MGIAPTTPELRQAVEANLFPVALPAVEPWNAFGWHGPDTAHENSSQALAIDVFGTLQQAPSRDVVLNALAEHIGLPIGGPWSVRLEWRDAVGNYLHESAITEVDVLLTSPHAVIYGECKFTEPGGSKCSKTKRRASGAQCNGHYAPQTNSYSCAYTAEGVRYWEVIPAAFDYANSVEYHPCPFAGEEFQWMRNITGAVEAARHSGKQAGFLLAYADGPNLPIARHLRNGRWQSFVNHMRPEAICVKAMSYQALLELAHTVAPADPVWPELTTWVERKITNVCRKLKR